MSTLILGNCSYIDCGTAIRLSGHEIFNLRSGPNDGQLLVDFDVFDQADGLLARIRKSQAVHVADGYTVKADAKKTEVFAPDGTALVSAEATGADTVTVLGTFWRGGRRVDMTTSGLSSGGNTFSRMTTTRCGTGIDLG